MYSHRKSLLPCAVAAVLFVLIGCSQEVAGPKAGSAGLEAQAVQTGVVKTDGVTVYEGVIGGENRYAFLVPDDWNGELVLYAHGFIDAEEPLGLPTKDNAVAIRDRVVAMGFAWAYGSYRENGLAIKDGAWATRQLRNVFIATVKSRPAYAVQADPTGFGIISRLKQTPLPGRNGAELLQSLITAIGFNYRGIHDVLERTNGACPVDNAETVYEAAAPGLLPPEVPAMINANVQRLGRDIPTEELFERHYEPSGRLAIPMIALHNEHDPVVPLFHEILYAAKVAASGRSQMLERRVMPRYAHTDFDAQDAADEAAEALIALRAKAVPVPSL